ncbi:MAG: Bax protein [Candidatus Pelagisphaera sp.]|jgi:Bax protein
MKRKPNLKWLRGVDMKTGSHRDLAVVIAGACLFLILGSLFMDLMIQEEEQEMPNFALIVDMKERKQAFFEYMLPFAEEANDQILKERSEVERLMAEFLRKGDLSRRGERRINELLETYDFDAVEAFEEQTFKDLLSRVDEIPPSLALSQAALESGWGSSRFAREGYNLFGMWCYEPGCGFVPSRRPAGKSYEVTKYESPKDSFAAYINNLNTNRYYVAMRAIRRELRSSDGNLNGYELAAGLHRYSQEGYVYISKVQSLIQSNQLGRFD